MAKKKSTNGDEMDGAQTAPAKPYVVLARKYRPQTFDDLIGQEAMVTTLQECVRGRPHRARLHADRRARRRQDDDRAHPGPRANYEAPGIDKPTIDMPVPGASLPRDHGGPAPGRARDGRRLQHRRRQHPRDHRERALHAARRAHQGLHHRRSPHAVEGRVQRAPEDARGAAGAREVHLRDDGNPQGAGHGAVALPALRPAPRRAAGAGRSTSGRSSPTRAPAPTTMRWR